MSEEMQEKDVTPVEVSDMQKVWQEYLQKCCEVGQLDHALSQLESQQRELEKQTEVAKRAAKSAAARHRELQQKELASKQAEAV